MVQCYVSIDYDEEEGVYVKMEKTRPAEENNRLARDWAKVSSSGMREYRTGKIQGILVTFSLTYAICLVVGQLQ